MKRLKNGDLEVEGKVWERSTKQDSNPRAWTRGEFRLSQYDYAWGDVYYILSLDGVESRGSTPEECFDCLRDAARDLVVL